MPIVAKRAHATVEELQHDIEFLEQEIAQLKERERSWIDRILRRDIQREREARARGEAPNGVGNGE